MVSDSATAPANRAGLIGAAVHRAAPLSRAGLLERAFSAAFSGLVYPQIWEDPEVDLAALALPPGARLATIASGGCNMMSYLVADPAEIVAVDLNPHHVALGRLKLAGARLSPNYATFYRFFGQADARANVAVYDRYLRDALDPETRAYWERRDWRGRRRITRFSRNFHAHGLLGNFIRFGQWAARRMGVELAEITQARDLAAQRAFFDARIAPLFDRALVRWITRRKASLFGLGIPPAQYDALAGGRAMAAVLRERLEKLACDFPIADNYFAWQAFTGAYAPGDAGPLPPYLRSANFAAMAARADRVRLVNRSLTDRLADEPAQSLDAYVLLDAQDWMTDAQLNALWREIDRTARPGARVIFRTAGVETILPGRLAEAVLARWRYHAEASAAFGARDRSAIYGGFHLYTREG